MTASSTLESMWLMVWGNTTIGAIAILATFAYLCYRKKYGILETLYVIFPIIIGMAISPVLADRYLPAWVGGLFIMGIGALWGLALTKVFNSLEPYTKIYLAFLAMNLALTLSGYSLATYTYLNTGAEVDMAGASTQYPTGSSAVDFMGATTGIKGIVIPVFDFFLGGGVIGFLMVSGLPSEAVTLIGYPIGFLALLALLPLLKILWDIIKSVIDATVGIAAKFLGR